MLFRSPQAPIIWHLMSRQTVTSGNSWFRAANQWSLNADDKDNEQFSALDTLEQHRDASGAFTLKLVFPGTDSAPQTWKQTTNPVTASQGGVAGYEPIDVPHTGCYWGGLERGGGSSLLDGSVNSGNWWYAVGARTSHGGGTPVQRAWRQGGAAARAVGTLLVGVARAAAEYAAAISTAHAAAAKPAAAISTAHAAAAKHAAAISTACRRARLRLR